MMFRPASDWHPDIDSVTAERTMQIAVSRVAKMRFRFMANGCLCKGLACEERGWGVGRGESELGRMQASLFAFSDPLLPTLNPHFRCGMVCRLQTKRRS